MPFLSKTKKNSKFKNRRENILICFEGFQRYVLASQFILSDNPGLKPCKIELPRKLI